MVACPVIGRAPGMDVGENAACGCPMKACRVIAAIMGTMLQGET
jgi:hypothetical protein